MIANLTIFDTIQPLPGLMENTVFIVPGYKHCPSDKAYQEIAKIIYDQGFSSVPISIPWKRITISQGTDYFLHEYKKKLKCSKRKIGKTYILGFSYGAMIAFIASAKINVEGLILCSLSPYFKEDFLKAGKYKRYRDFVDINCKTLCKKTKAKKVLMLYGEKEDRSLRNRVLDAYDEISSPDKILMQIKNTDHEIGNRRYIDKISSAIKTLN